MVTHSTQYLPDVDHIIVMETGGKILASGNLTQLKALQNDRIEEIISVKEREEEEKKEKDKKTENKPDAKKDIKKDGKDGGIISKESAQEGALSSKIFKEYLKNFGEGWMLFYIFIALVYMVADVAYSVWLTGKLIKFQIEILDLKFSVKIVTQLSKLCFLCNFR